MKRPNNADSYRRSRIPLCACADCCKRVPGRTAAVQQQRDAARRQFFLKALPALRCPVVALDQWRERRVDDLAVVASHARRLRRAMERVKLSALRRAGTGLSGERWRLLVRLNDRRNALLREWGVL